jgi:hypothetical protein
LTAAAPPHRRISNGAPPAMSYFFSTPVDIDIVLEDLDDRSAVDVKLDKTRKEKVPLYLDGESVKGQVTVRPKDGKRLEHTGIKVQFIGTIGASPHPPHPPHPPYPQNPPPCRPA